MLGSRHTVALGTNLHIVAVTAKTAAPTLNEGGHLSLRYDVQLRRRADRVAGRGDRRRQTRLLIHRATPAYLLLAPRDINQLRLITGSCRIPHGNGKDTF